MHSRRVRFDPRYGIGSARSVLGPPHGPRHARSMNEDHRRGDAALRPQRRRSSVRPMKIAFLALLKPAAQYFSELVSAYGQSDLSDADYIVAIGGDGTVLKALHAAPPTAEAVLRHVCCGFAGVPRKPLRGSPAFLSDCEWHAA